MIHKITILLFFSLFSFSLLGQTLKEFSKDNKEFMTQLEGFVNKNKREDIAKIYKSFKTKVDGGAFTAEQFTTIQGICDTMLKMKMNPSPYFVNFISVLTTTTSLEDSSEKIDEFTGLCNEIINRVEKRNFNNYKNYLAFINTFYSDNALKLSSSSIWRVESDKYNFSFEEKELKVDFEKLTLVGVRKQDSIVIQETQGAYYPFLGVWKGEGGKVSWEHLDMKDVYAELGKYEFELKKNGYISKDATLYFPKYFPNQPLKGTFEDKVIVKSASSKATFPKFESDQKVLQIDNIGADVQYKGGFKLSGATVYGYGDKENRAAITVLSSETKAPVMRARSLQFTIKEDVRRILSQGTEIVLYFGADSIYHPSTNLRFEIDEKSISISRGERGSDRNPFFDSYHNVNIDTDKIDWKVDSDSILIAKKTVGIGGGNESQVNFESFHFFSEGGYRELQNISTVNPIAAVMAYSRDLGSDELDADGLAEKINPRFDASSIQSLLYSLVAKGFIEYDKDEKKIYIKEKLKHYALAGVKKTDFDHISILSKSKETNAILYVNEKNENPIDIHAVNYVEFTPVQKVAAKPLNNQILLKKNRNMEFNGKVFGGMSIFQGRGFQFDYNGFQIKMDTIYFMDLFENSGEEDENGDPIAYSIGSRIENVTGTLLIDAPHNKSGNEEIDMFPSFASDGYSFIYYDDRAIEDGVYKRDSFYFRLNEFGLNNLDRYTVADINFEGEMFSADIFPVFEETVVLMGEDKSLGFNHKTPSNGYPAYVRGSAKGKGNYKGDVILSHSGFQGKGTLTYLQAEINSQDLIFKPREALGSAMRFDIDEQRAPKPEIPQVRGIDINVRWLPYKDTMYVMSKEAPFAMYKSNLHTLEGTLALTPGGLWGDGLLDWPEASMNSKDFHFGAFSVESEQTDLSIKAVGTDGELAFDSKNVRADVNFDEGIGKFKSNSDEITTSMPYNKYKTSMNEFTWDMNKETVEFKAKEGRVDKFLSPELDSLQFEGATALYDLKTSTLKIGGVPFIKTADALVFPETGDVEIIAGGTMKPLENAKIIASEETKYHVINKATIRVKGRLDYTASGYYEYNIGDKKQEILFSDIIGSPVGKGKRTEKALATRGSGEVTGEDEFYIDHKTMFKGNIGLSSDEKDLMFKGYAKLDAELPQNYWFNITSKGDKNNLAIAYSEPKRPEGDPLNTGLFIDRMTNNPYPSIMGVLVARKDRALMDVKGVFKYNKTKDAFIFGDSLKLTTGNYTGNTFEVNLKNRTCTATGTFNVGEWVKYLKPTVVGKTKIDLIKLETDSTGTAIAEKQKLTLDLMAKINYILPEEAVKAMTKDLQMNTAEVPKIELNAAYEKMLPDVIGGLVKNKTEFDQVYKNYQTTSKVTLPVSDKPLLFFSYLPMKWNPNLQSLVSSKKKLGLAQVNGTPINKMVEAYVEFRMPLDEIDKMHVYIKNPADGGHLYYFKYSDGLLQTYSTNPTFMAAITGAKKKDLEIKMGKNQVYKITNISPVSADMFVSRIKSAW